MRKLVICVFALATFASSALAKEACPPSKYGPPYPWLIAGPIAGDDFADVYIDIDQNGRPINCRMGQNNIDGDNKFFVCKAFMEQFTTAPPAVNPTAEPPALKMPAGSQVRATIHHQYVGYGTAHLRAESKARKEFFRQHPEERPECYSSDD